MSAGLRTGAIRLRGLDFAFPGRSGTQLPVLDGVDLEVPGGGIVALIGPNGCGKSTLLRVIAGLLAPGRGVVELDGEPVSGPDPRIGLVFQEPRLLSWRSAADNIIYPLELAGWPDSRQAERLATLIQLVGLDPAVIGSRPSELSGGTSQRVALARALALEPEVLLLDEPFSALDALTRGILQDEVLRICAETNQTVFMITHDVDEAILLGDRVIVLSERPATVREELKVNLPRPRRPEELARNDEYVELRAHILSLLNAPKPTEVAA